MLLQYVWSDPDDVIGRDAENVAVERAVVYGAHRQSVRNDGLTSIGVLLDVRSVE